MRAEKKSLTQEYVTRLNGSPFFIVADYRGLKVGPITELRRRLAKAGAEMHVVKNSVFKVAAKEAGLADLEGVLLGQLAVVTGQRDIAGAAKVLKSFRAEFEKPQIRFGYLKDHRLEKEQIETIAELPGLDVLRRQLLGMLVSPTTTLVRLLQTPASQLARVLKAKAEKSAA